MKIRERSNEKEKLTFSFKKTTKKSLGPMVPTRRIQGIPGERGEPIDKSNRKKVLLSGNK